MRGSDPFGGHGSRAPDRCDDRIGTPLEQQVEEAAAAHQPDAATQQADAWGEIVDFASAELGEERAEELRREGAELPLDDFTALLR